ncbi:MAG: hypothetical protein P1U90_16910 [Akkermansiaceae bacterium]|nr:hypothetical protein [Akkermansiaceae bacterium]
MDNALENLESKLEAMTPRGLSDEGWESCHQLIDRLVGESELSTRGSSSRNVNGIGTAAAAAIALSIGISGGWYFGKNKASSPAVVGDQIVETGDVAAFEHLDHEAWVLTEESPNVYVTKSGEIREISREVEVTKDVVQHRESGVVVTVETTDHHVVDAPKSDF